MNHLLNIVIMRTPILISLILMVFFQNVIGQAIPKGTQVFSHNDVLTRCDLKGDSLGGNKGEAELKAGWKFNIVRLTEDKQNYVISLLPFTNDDLKNEYNVKDGESVYFTIPVTEYDFTGEDFKSRFDFTAGIVTMPLKFRPSKKDSIQLGTGENAKRDFDLATNLNIGTAMGLKIRFGRYGSKADNSLNFLVGAAVTPISADSLTTNGVYKDSQTELFGGTINICTMLEHNKVQAIIGVGWDFLGGQIGKNWNYQGAPWIGIGIGTSLFDTNLSGRSNKGSKKGG